MLRSGFHPDLPRTVMFKWYLLSVLSGSVNAGGFLAVQCFVTHVTGFATLFGVSLAHGNWFEGIGFLSVPLFFLSGAAVASYFLDHRYRVGREPRYALVMGMVCVCLVIVAMIGNRNGFGVFGGQTALAQDYFLLSLLSLASGLQNAAVTTASDGRVRTCHLTGPLTDFGIGLTRVLFPVSDVNVVARERKEMIMKGCSIFSFIAGSVLGALLFIKFQYLGFLFPAGIALYSIFQLLGPQVSEEKSSKI